MMTKRIITLDNVLIKLNNYSNEFYKEANVVNYFKCILLNELDIKEFNVNGISVYVEDKGDGYYLFYEDQCLKVVVQNKMIVNIDY